MVQMHRSFCLIINADLFTLKFGYVKIVENLDNRKTFNEFILYLCETKRNRNLLCAFQVKLCMQPLPVDTALRNGTETESDHQIVVANFQQVFIFL